MGVPPFKQTYPLAPVVQSGIVSQWRPVYYPTHEHAQLPNVPVAIPPFKQIWPLAPVVQPIRYPQLIPE
jgi:hypothetical protein